MDETSLTLLSDQVYANAAYIYLGVPGVLGNALLLFLILRDKSLRSNFYLSLIHLTVADGLFCLVCVGLGLKRIILYAIHRAETDTPLNCAPWIFAFFLFENAATGQAFCIAIDRLLSTTLPVRYKSFSVRHLQLLNFAMWVIVLAVLIGVSSYMSTAPFIPNCTLGLIFLPVVNTINAWGAIALHIATILLYSFLIVVLFYRIHQAVKSGKNKKLARQSLQYRATITGLMNVGVYTIISLTGRVYNVVMGFYDPITRARLQPWSASIMLLGSVASLFVFIGRNTTLMSSIKSLCLRLKQHLSSTSPGVSSGVNQTTLPPIEPAKAMSQNNQNVPEITVHGLPEVNSC